MWKSDLSEEIKREVFQAVAVSVLLYCSTTWTITKHLEKTLNRNDTRNLRIVFNNSWVRHPTKQQLYGHYLPSHKLPKNVEPDELDTAG